MTTTRPSGWLWLFVASVVLALGISGWQARYIRQFRDPAPTVESRVGQPVSVAGTSFKLDAFTVAEQLPGREPTADPVVALPGAVLVQTLLTVEVLDPHRDLSTLYCEFVLVDDRGRRWRRSTEVEYDVAGPEALTCSGTTDRPVRLGRPFQLGVVFMVPAEAADQLRLRMRLPTEQLLVEFRR